MGKIGRGSQMGAWYKDGLAELLSVVMWLWLDFDDSHSSIWLWVLRDSNLCVIALQITDPSSRQRGRFTWRRKKVTVSQRNLSVHLSQRGPDTKTNWSTDRRSQYNLNLTIVRRVATDVRWQEAWELVGWSNESVVGQSQVGKNVSTEADYTVGSRHQTTGEDTTDWEGLYVLQWTAGCVN
jgi:hypothetical protein